MQSFTQALTIHPSVSLPSRVYCSIVVFDEQAPAIQQRSSHLQQQQLKPSVSTPVASAALPSSSSASTCRPGRTSFSLPPPSVCRKLLTPSRSWARCRDTNNCHGHGAAARHAVDRIAEFLGYGRAGSQETWRRRRPVRWNSRPRAGGSSSSSNRKASESLSGRNRPNVGLLAV